MRLYAIEVDRYGCGYVNARSRSGAVYSAFLSDAFSSYSFKEFLQHLKPKARLAAQAPADDGYGYVRRAYGVDPKIGQRVRLRHEGRSSGREGVVLYPGASTAHVLTLLDGDKEPVIVHPMNVELL